MSEAVESEDRRIRVVAVGVVRRVATAETGGGDVAVESEGRDVAAETEGGDVVAESEREAAAEELLVERHRNPSGEYFYRPLGGGVEFGETSEAALRREFREELGVSLSNVSYLETYEDVFDADGRTHHELWRCYEAEIVEDWPYDEDEFTVREPDLDEPIECIWKPTTELAPEDGDGETFYPGTLLEDC